MRKKPERATKRELPPLCTAVKRIRDAFGDSQERFARRIAVAVMTVSRFETGRMQPRSPQILIRLANAAREAGLPEEAKEFDIACVEAQRGIDIDTFYRRQHHPMATSFTTAAFGVSAYSLRQWRLMAAVRTAALYYPERVEAIEKAAGPALALVDEAFKLASATSGHLDYGELDSHLVQLAERHTLAEFQKGKKQQ